MFLPFAFLRGHLVEFFKGGGKAIVGGVAQKLGDLRNGFIGFYELFRICHPEAGHKLGVVGAVVFTDDPAKLGGADADVFGNCLPGQLFPVVAHQKVFQVRVKPLTCIRQAANLRHLGSVRKALRKLLGDQAYHQGHQALFDMLVDLAAFTAGITEIPHMLTDPMSIGKHLHLPHPVPKLGHCFHLRTVSPWMQRGQYIKDIAVRLFLKNLMTVALGDQADTVCRQEDILLSGYQAIAAGKDKMYFNIIVDMLAGRKVFAKLDTVRRLLGGKYQLGAGIVQLHGHTAEFTFHSLTSGMVKPGSRVNYSGVDLIKCLILC